MMRNVVPNKGTSNTVRWLEPAAAAADQRASNMRVTRNRNQKKATITPKSNNKSIAVRSAASPWSGLSFSSNGVMAR
jgi:hypothetical protein